MTKDYTDEEAREAIAIVKRVAETGEFDLERIRAFGKPPEPKRWPLRTKHASWKPDSGCLDLVAHATYDTSYCFPTRDMDRLFVAWAEERGIDLALILATIGNLTEYLTNADDVECRQQAARIRAVLDNAKVEP